MSYNKTLHHKAINGITFGGLLALTRRLATTESADAAAYQAVGNHTPGGNNPQPDGQLSLI